jgi:hypothetical protein
MQAHPRLQLERLPLSLNQLQSSSERLGLPGIALLRKSLLLLRQRQLTR